MSEITIDYSEEFEENNLPEKSELGKMLRGISYKQINIKK